MTGADRTPRIGDFDLLAKLGEGGMGAVYQARQVSMDRLVALKVLTPKLASNAEFVQRFLQEARATARLNHSNIVAGISVGQADGYHYFAMEYIEGQNLDQLIREKGALSEDECVRLGAAIASALAHAHANGIVHRDVKPANVLLDKDGVPKLADLGLAKAAYGTKEDSSLTQSGSAVGTPYYMAPEQARADPDIDGRADIYALGCTLYHAATGRTPFEADSPALIMVKHISEKMPHPRGYRPELSETFCGILERMLIRRREDRYAEMSQVADDLEALARGETPELFALPPVKSNFQSGPKLTTSARGLRPIGGGERGRTSKFPAAGARTQPSDYNREPVRDVTRKVPTRQGRPTKDASPLLAALFIAIPLLVVVLFFALRSKPESTDDAGAARTPPPPPVVKSSLEQRKPSAEPTGKAPPPAPPPTVPPVVPQNNIPPNDSNYTAMWRGDLNGWHVSQPQWEVRNGALHGEGTEGNAIIFIHGSPIPADCEIVVVADCSSNYWFGISGDDARSVFVARDKDTKVRIYNYYYQNAQTAETQDEQVPKGRVANGEHTFKFQIKGTQLRVEVDGQPLTTFEKVSGPVQGGHRNFCVCTERGGQILVKEIKFRGL